MGLGTFKAKAAAENDKKEAMSANGNETDAFMPTPLPKGKTWNLTQLAAPY